MVKVPSLKRISFVAHSLGGLFARYAVAMLYTPRDDESILEDLENRGEVHPVFRGRQEPKIAGLEAVNFVTLASPHLGVRGKQQVQDFVFVFEFSQVIIQLVAFCLQHESSESD